MTDAAVTGGPPSGTNSSMESVKLNSSSNGTHLSQAGPSLDVTARDIYGPRRRSSRYSIMSDPRLSQLFALSSQLEALAESCCQDGEETVKSSLTAVNTSSPPPPLPPKASMVGRI